MMIEYVYVAICPHCNGCHAQEYDDNDLETDRFLSDMKMRGYTLKRVSIAEANAIPFTWGCGGDDEDNAS